jgi:hypothetical protein
VALSSAETYDPKVGIFSPVASMPRTRSGQTATLLPDGLVLLIGGSGSGAQTADFYDPTTDSFSMAGLTAYARTNHTATLLAGGSVLIAGGWNGSQMLSSAEVCKG